MISKSLTKLDQSMFYNMLDITALHPWLKNANKGFEHLMLTLAQSLDEQALILELLRRFKYLTSDDLNNFCIEMEKHIIEVWSLDPGETLVAPLHNGNDIYADSSQMMCQAFKASCAVNGHWPATKFRASVPQAVKAKPEPKNIILIDEFIGTGKQALGVLNYVKKEAETNEASPRVYLLAAACMERSKEVLEPKVDGYFAPLVMRRGISDSFEAGELALKISIMESLESRLLSKRNHDTLQKFGYERSEALYKCQISTTADNVFPVFHWRWLHDGATRPTILPPRL